MKNFSLTFAHRQSADTRKSGNVTTNWLILNVNDKNSGLFNL